LSFSGKDEPNLISLQCDTNKTPATVTFEPSTLKSFDNKPKLEPWELLLQEKDLKINKFEEKLKVKKHKMCELTK